MRTPGFHTNLPLGNCYRSSENFPGNAFNQVFGLSSPSFFRLFLRCPLGAAAAFPIAFSHPFHFFHTSQKSAQDPPAPFPRHEDSASPYSFSPGKAKKPVSGKCPECLWPGFFLPRIRCGCSTNKWSLRFPSPAPSWSLFLEKPTFGVGRLRRYLDSGRKMTRMTGRPPQEVLPLAPAVVT